MLTGAFLICKPSLPGCSLGPAAGGLCLHPSMQGMTVHVPGKQVWHTMAFMYMTPFI